MTKAPEPQPVNRIERILAFMMVGIVLLSILCLMAIPIASGQGMQREDFATGIWPFVVFLPNIGLPIAILLILTLTFLTMRRRRREANGR